MGMKQRLLLPLLFAVVGSCTPAAAAAQQPAQVPAADTVRVVQVQEADDVREQLRAILQVYPRAVGEILRRDPSLMSRADYMASYPQLAQFLASHPEIQRNVEFYLEGYGAWQSNPMDPEYEALGVLLGGLAGFMVFSAVIGMLTWTVRAVISHRRWLKASTVQAEVHSKLMDRMTGNEELLAYIQSPAGRRFLEAVPPPKDSEAPGFGAPVGSILWSMMAGIVFATVGAGFRVAAGTIGDEVQRAFTVVGIILLSLGIGFLFASLMAFAVSARLGLFPARTTPQSSSTNA